jgi:7-cyano-7-deazaguanine synthase
MNIITSLSGGMDSAVLLWKLLKEGHTVRCLSVDYGQRHVRELESAGKLAEVAGCEWKLINLSSIRTLMSGSSQTDYEMPVPEGHYTDRSMRQTVVPNRNMLLLALAGAWAVSTKSEAVAYAAHAGDHAVYPDCRPEFTEAMAEALGLCDWHPVKLLRPFLYPEPMDKTAVAKLGAALGVPFHLTYSCYKGFRTHCGKCGTCVERREAFNLGGIPDPTPYESVGGK